MREQNKKTKLTTNSIAGLIGVSVDEIEANVRDGAPTGDVTEALRWRLKKCNGITGGEREAYFLALFESAEQVLVEYQRFNECIKRGAGMPAVKRAAERVRKALHISGYLMAFPHLSPDEVCHE